MNSCAEQFEFKMSRYEVLKYSGCLSRLLTRLLIIAISAICVIWSKTIGNNTLQVMAIAISSGFLFAFATIIVRDFILLFKIIAKRYEIVTKAVRSFASKRPFDTFNNCYKVLVFDDVRLTVEQKFLDGLSVGDLVTLVFANGVKYPIVMVKRTPCFKIKNDI